MKILHTSLYNSIYKSLNKSTITLNSQALLKNSALAIAASAIVTLPALAQDELNSQTPKVTLPTIIVTATRTPTTMNNTIAQTRVIDSKELKRYQGQTAIDVIKRQPGFAQFSYGGMGTAGNFYLRGYDYKGILVLIDGVRYSSLSAGGASLGLLPAEHIDRIEVLYGASGSSMYGADAMGGVIQIFTKGQNVEQTQLSVTAGAGNNDHYLYGASAQIRNENGTSISISASHNETDGGYSATTLPKNTWSYNADDDGFKSDNYSLNIKHSVNDELTLGASGIYSESTTDIDSADQYNWTSPYEKTKTALSHSYADQKNGAGMAYAQYATDQYDAKLSYGYSEDKSSTYEYESHIGNPAKYDTKQQQIGLTGGYNLTTGKAIYGVEHLKQELESNVYEADDRKVTSGYLGYVASYNNADVQANIRYDDYSDFDSETTYNLGMAYHLTPELRAGINYAKGYRVPTFNDLYGPASWGSNPELKPESSDNFEAFFEYATPSQITRLTGYHNKVDDLIARSGNKIENVEEAKIKGISLTSDWNINDYLLGLSYDYQDAKNDSGQPNSNDGNYLPIRPEHKGIVYVGYQLSDLDVRAEYQYVDDYYYDASNNTKVDSYNLVNISSNYQLTDALSMSARLNNVFNKKYVTAPGYSTDDGTNFFTSLTYSWK